MYMYMYMLCTMVLSSFVYAVENSSLYLDLEKSVCDDLFHHQNLLEYVAYFPVIRIYMYMYMYM